MLNRCLFYAVAAVVCSLTVAHSQTASVVTLLNYEGVSPAVGKGNAPRGGLLLGADGLLYGTTELGGTVTSLLTAPLGAGTIYKFTPSGSFAFTAVADFDSATTGGTPTGQLMLASDGNYYGTTSAGGGASGSRGTVFQLTPAGGVTTVYTFQDLTRANTGIVPTGQLVEGADGYLYGTTSLGGANSLGTIFKVLPGAPNTPIRVADFSTGTGTSPSPLMRASDGNFYGVAAGGGLYSNGTVFKLTPTGGFTTLASVGNIIAAATSSYTGPVAPSGALIQGKDGILYGTSASGGTGGAGTVFSVTTAGVIKTIVNFTGTSGLYPGNTPDASLMQATDGYLYGTTKLGGTPNRGTIFRVSTAGTLFKSLAQFTGGTPVFGASPRGALVQDNEGHLFGTTSVGGANNLGTIFRLDNALPDKASIATGGVTNPFGGTRATVTGSINPQGTTTLYWFEYGLTSAYGSRAPLASASAGAGKVNLAVQTTLTGLTPSTTYHFRLVATNGGGIVWGSDEVFVTGPNPTIVTPPVDQLVGIGSPFAFDVDAVGVALSYLWFQNGVSKAVTTHNYSVAKAALTNAGNYTVRVADGLDSVITAPARLGVISVADTSMTVNEADPLGATLALPNAGPGMTFQWKTAAGNVVDGGRITGAQTASLKIANPNGTDTNTYFCTVSLGSLTLDSGNFNLTIRLVPVMNVPMLGPWTVNGNAFGSVSAQNSPTSYTAIGLPPGVVLNATTGVLSGHVGNAPNVYTLHLTATNLAGKSHQLDYAVTVLPALAGESGSFAGIVTRDGTANNNLGGGINFNLASTGSGTGKLTHLGKVFSFTTALSNAPGVTRDVILTPTAGQVGFPAVVATLTGATGDVVGTVNSGAFTAKRNLSSVPLAQQGRFNIALSTGGMQIGDPAFPQGSGYISFVIDAVGNVTWSSELSDGTKGTGSSVLPGTGVVSLHQALYLVGTGSAQGAITIANDGSVSSGSIDWLKTTQTGATRSYKTGFALHTLDVLGSKYVKPLTGTQVIGLTMGTTQFNFTQGGLSPAITQPVNFPSTNVITVPLPNANTVKVTSLDLTTGIFLGSLVVPAVPTTNTRTASFAGILLQGLHQGIGHFNLATLPTPTTSPMLSGRVVLN